MTIGQLCSLSFFGEASLLFGFMIPTPGCGSQVFEVRG